MPASRILITLGLLVVLAALVSSPSNFWPSVPPPTASRDLVVATVGNLPITLREVEQVVTLPLYQADQQRSQLLYQALQRKIEETLLEAEASRKGISVSQLLTEASQSELIARLANLPAPVKRLTAVTSPAESDLQTLPEHQEQARLRQALLLSLRRQADIRINLPEPELPILPVSADDDPSTGPSGAPITIVEFSDFQCPYCKLSVPVVKEVLAKYPGKVRVVYRDYPGPNHPYAQQAAEAAQCAGEQGKFWEYHDILFDRQTAGTGWDFSGLAKELGLQLNHFATCLKTGRYREEVAKDLRDGFKLGISSTPTFFVNGRPLVGARSFVDFQALIDTVLKQHSQS